MAYKLIKAVILRAGYDKQEIMDKLDVYLAFGRITVAEYTELAEMAEKHLTLEKCNEIAEMMEL